MGVDFEAFATAFAGTLAKDITARKAKTEEYGEQQRELAEKNKGIVAQRRQLKQSAMGLANQAKSLLATPEMISAALDSGADGLPKLVQSLTKARSVHGKRWDQQKANTVVSLPEGYVIPEGDLASRIAKSYGLGEASLGSTEAPERSFWDKGLGRGGRQAVRAELDEEAFYSGYSVMDINEIAAQEDYKSLTGGTFLNYAMPNVFDPDNVSDELRVFNAMRSATKTSPAYEALNAQLKVKQEAATKDMSVEEAAAIATDIKGIEASMLALEYDAMREFATAQVDRFGESYIDAMGPVLSGTFPNLLTTGMDEDETEAEVEATTDTPVTIQDLSENSGNTVTVDTETGNATIQLNTPNEMFGKDVTAQTDLNGNVIRLDWTNGLGEKQSVTDPATIKMILKEIETPTAMPDEATTEEEQGYTPPTVDTTTARGRNRGRNPNGAVKKAEVPVEATEEDTPVSAPETEAVVTKHGSDILKFLRSEGFTSEDTEEDIVQGLAAWYASNSTDLSIKPAPTDLSPVAYVMKLMLDKG